MTDVWKKVMTNLNNMKKINQLTLIISILFILPNLVFASWWNPFSWKIFNKKVVPQDKILNINTDVIIGNDLKTENDDFKERIGESVPVKKDVSVYKVEEVKKDIVIVTQNSTTTPLASTSSLSTLSISTSTDVVKFDDIVPVLIKNAPNNFSDEFHLYNSDFSITLQQALVYAIKAGKISGVRPAFIMAIYDVDTNIYTKTNGELCYLYNKETGSSISKSGKFFQNGMKSDRDLVPFLEIISKLGKNYSNTLISCPVSEFGMGGAMGPANFLPSKWKLYIDRLYAILGHYPNPWNPGDSFMAFGLVLKDLEANTQTYTKELDVACKLWSGKVCNSSLPSGISYANEVMKIANVMQTYVDYFETK